MMAMLGTWPPRGSLAPPRPLDPQELPLGHSGTRCQVHKTDVRLRDTKQQGQARPGPVSSVSRQEAGQAREGGTWTRGLPQRQAGWPQVMAMEPDSILSAKRSFLKLSGANH